ncbi:MAG: hypothetical protein LIO46_05355, partial [Clostridiales bacterium]|nr:hypothetical protein [Clostridiales bacterium]
PAPPLPPATPPRPLCPPPPPPAPYPPQPLPPRLAGESGPNGTFHLTAQQQQYWLEKNAQISAPFTYGYRSGWDSLLQTAEIFTFLILAVCIGVAPVFAGEYQAGTDAVLLAARYGKNKLITGKLAASLLFATAVFLLGCLLCVGLPLLLFGGGGWDLPIQLSFFFSPRPLTYLQAALILLGITYLVLLAFTALSLFLSARLKNAFSVLIVIFLLLFVPYFMSYSESSALYNLIFQLIPLNALQCSFQYTMLYSFGSLHLNIQTMTCLVYGVMFLLFLPLSRRTFRRHQSGS